jgi:hypothetical protein
MADKTIKITNENIPLLLHDNGDGTWSLDVNATLAANPTIDIGDIQLLAGTALIGSVISPMVSVASAFSGQIAVTTPGTSIQGSNVALINGVYIKALAANTGKMYIGYATGDNRAMFELSADAIVLVQVSNLNQVWIDASVAGEKVCWIKA